MADRTESSIHVDAKPGIVLDVIADFEAYPEWAAEVKRVAVLSEEGDGWADRVEYTLDAGVIKDTYTLDYEWDIADDGTGVVSWSLVRATVLKAMNGSYTIARDKGGAKVTYRLAVDLNIPMLGMLKRKAEQQIVDTALKELKKRVEGLIVTVEGSDRVGSVAEEAARLLGIFAAGMPDATLREAGSRVAGEPLTAHVCPECGHDPHAASPTDAVCRVCPICRVLNVVKAISPETLEKIADVVDLVSDGLRGFAATRRSPMPTPRPPAPPAPPQDSSPETSETSQVQPPGEETQEQA